VGCVRIGKYTDDTLIINPSNTLRADDSMYKFDLTVCGKDGNINMIEVGGKEITEETLVASLKKASEEIEALQAWQKKIVAEIGKEKKIIPACKIPKMKSFNLSFFSDGNFIFPTKNQTEKINAAIIILVAERM